MNEGDEEDVRGERSRIRSSFLGWARGSPAAGPQARCAFVPASYRVHRPPGLGPAARAPRSIADPVDAGRALDLLGDDGQPELLLSAPKWRRGRCGAAQPIASAIWSMVAPSGRCSISIIRACLVSAAAAATPRLDRERLGVGQHRRPRRARPLGSGQRRVRPAVRRKRWWGLIPRRAAAPARRWRRSARSTARRRCQRRRRGRGRSCGGALDRLDRVALGVGIAALAFSALRIRARLGEGAGYPWSSVASCHRRRGMRRLLRPRAPRPGRWG